MSTKKKVGFFFGAGAEIGYGLPSGGKFALEIFKGSKEEDREKFRDQLAKINLQSQIATQWLPANFQSKRLNIFGKGNFEEIISSSLEHRRASTLKYLENFDENISSILLNWDISEQKLHDNYAGFMGEAIGDKLYSQEILLNKKLAEQVTLFDSQYFSAFLKLLEANPDTNIKRIITAFLELLIGALGQNLVSQLNDELFEKAPNTVNVFDDLSGIFHLNYASIGQTGMEIVIEESRIPVNDESDVFTIFTELGKTILEQIYSQTLDYQSLIDSHFRYLYNPKSQWAKFTKIAVFLYTVQRYILAHTKIDSEKIQNGPGFYHDLNDLKETFEITSIGTTNYNNFIAEVYKGTESEKSNVYHLNGNVLDYYDPYKNRIVGREGEVDNSKQILVPFIFTQSGVKPLTSITMSQRYVELYEQFKKSDYICIIGYNFNGDDGHINGMFRNLIEEDQKEVHIFHYAEENITLTKLQRLYKEKLRIDSIYNLKIHLINSNREVDGRIWYSSLY